MTQGWLEKSLHTGTRSKDGIIVILSKYTGSLSSNFKMNIRIPLVIILTGFQRTLGITKANEKPPQNDKNGQNFGGTI